MNGRRRLRVAWAAVIVGSAGAVGGLAPLHPASAASPADPPSSSLFTTDSTVTVGWTDPDQPARPSSGPVYDNLKSFELRVSQTRGLLSQSVQVSWSGVTSPNSPGNRILQLMQCWSDGPTPDPTDDPDALVPPRREQCAWGGGGLTAQFSASRQYLTEDPEYPRFQIMIVAEIDGVAQRQTNGPRFASIQEVTLGAAQRPFDPNPDDGVTPVNPNACPAGTAAYDVLLRPPLGVPTTTGNVLPNQLAVVQPTPGLPPTTQVPDLSATYDVSAPPFRLSDVATQAEVVDDGWPIGRYTVEIRCLTGTDPTATPLRRYVTALTRLNVTEGGQRTAVWQLGSPDNPPVAVIPFDPLGDSSADAPTGTEDPLAVQQFIQPSVTNEINRVPTDPDGNGNISMELLIDLDAPHLGCGRVVDGRPRACWLVAVPRWAPEPTVQEAQGTFDPGLSPGPLDLEIWSRRVQVPLYFLPVASGCTIGEGLKQIVTNDMTRPAFLSWQPAFCRTPETAASVSNSLQDFQVRGALSAPNRMGVVGVPPPVAGTLVTAPVASSALVIALAVDRPTGGPFTQLNLTPRLVAKLLTQSYSASAQPNGPSVPQDDPALQFPAENRRNLVDDPEFIAINPEYSVLGPSGYLHALTVAANTTDAYQVLWQWVLSDEDAKEFLDGEPDPSGMRVNPFYRGLITEQTAGFSVLDPTCRQVLAQPEYAGWPPLCTFNYQARTENDLASGRSLVRGDPLRRTVLPTTPNQQPQTYAADSRIGRGDVPSTLLAVTTAAAAERFGLFTASLRNADGQFVTPTLAAMASARDQMPVRDDGVLVPDPSTVGNDGYPLTVMSYASVDVAETTQAQNDAFADMLEYIAGPGQVVGRVNGLLPPGYLPLSPRLAEQTLAAATLLRDPSALLPPPSSSPAPTSPAVSTTPTQTPPPPGGGSPVATGGFTSGTTSATTPTAATSAQSTPAAAEPAESTADLGVNSGLAATITAGTDGDWIWWVVPIVLGIGVASIGTGVGLARLARRGTGGTSP